MARKSAGTKKKASPVVRLKRNALTVAIVALILYIGAHMISRTDGARAAIADKLSNGTRQLITLEKCGTTPLLGLRLRGLSFQGVSVPEATVSFNWFSFLSRKTPFVKELRIQGLEVNFTRVPNTGNWEPLVMHGVGTRLGAVVGLNPSTMGEDDALPKFPAYAINEKTLLQLKGAKIVWRDEKGRELAYITEASLSVKSETFIKRKVIQTIAKCGHVKLASGRALRDFRLEAFRIEGTSLVTVLDMADSNGQYEPFASKTLWQDLNLHLSQLTELK
jgi:hypothetical protein